MDCSNSSDYLTLSHQVYEATFNIAHTAHPLRNFQSKDASVALSLRLLDYAFKVYEDDVRRLVEEGVKHSLGPVDESDEDNPLVQQRLRALTQWLKQETPLGHANAANALLIRAIRNDPRFLEAGLPRSQEGHRNIYWFANKILDAVDQMCRGREGVHAPFITKGASLAAMRAVVDQIRSLLALPLDEDGNSTVINLIVKSANQRQIANIPWARGRAPGPGRHPTKVIYDIWINLGKPKGPGRLSLPGPCAVTPSDRRDKDGLQSTKHMTLTDCRASWSTKDLKLEDLYRILDHTCLPDEWNLKQVTLPNNDEYVAKTYRWVTKFYDGAKPIHKTAMLLSIIFSRCLPNIFHDRNTPHSARGADEITRRVRNEAWIPKANMKQGGFSQRIPFVIMMATFIIAMYEDKSPLRAHMALHGNSFGEEWTKKHGVSVPFAVIEFV